MPTYQGQKVVSRPATAKDPGFDPKKGAQLIVTMPDHSTKLVPAVEVQAQDPQPTAKPAAPAPVAKPIAK
jgi:hypothetical protein